MHHARNGFLTAKGLAEAAQRERQLSIFEVMGLTRGEDWSYLDKVCSVSGLRRDEDLYEMVSDTKIDEQARRFLRGY